MKRVLVCLVLIAVGVALDKGLWEIPREWNPLAPLRIQDPVTPVTGWKIKRLREDREGCLAALESFPDKALDYRALEDYAPVANCPLTNVVRLNASGVSFNRGFVASCPLALGWLMFEHHVLQPAAREHLGSPVRRVEHYGSFACRNIYGRQNARRSAHATADALDVAAFTLEDGRRASVLADWRNEGERGRFLRELHRGACRHFATVLGPDYNAAHANHFHLAMGGFGTCR
ncbi:extensin-like domain-containing protein [Halomonas garicola]|uniref:extensin-like domain-containing protein n=1 Tax=Halomonas garicola TaxID=1690008 RepID=UPI00289C4A8E|nr:extensin family protein [Halomonas garicola]